LVPADTGSGASVKVIDKSDCACTNVLAVALLLAAAGSGVIDEAVAVALKFPVCDAATATTTVAARTSVVPVRPDHVHTTGLAALQTPPALGVTETKLVPAGSGKLKAASCAADKPALVKVRV